MTTTMASGVDTKRITEAQARLSALGHRVFADGRVGPQSVGIDNQTDGGLAIRHGPR